jgi:hypothetical protein
MFIAVIISNLHRTCQIKNQLYKVLGSEKVLQQFQFIFLIRRVLKKSVRNVMYIRDI